MLGKSKSSGNEQRGDCMATSLLNEGIAESQCPFPNKTAFNSAFEADPILNCT